MALPDAANEQALVERCRRRDAEAFGLLMDAYQNRVYGFVRRMLRDPEEAADAAQEVFIKAYQAFDRFDGRSSLRTWLFRIAYNQCVDRARKLGRSPVESNLEDDDLGAAFEIADDRWDPEQFVMNSELAGIVEEALGTMSDKLRSVLLLHDREDMGYDEIAAALGLPVGTVKSRLFLARGHLQKCVAGYLGEGQP